MPSQPDDPRALVAISKPDTPGLMGGVPAAAWGEPEEEQSFNVGRLVAALVRHKWLIVVLALLGTAAGVGASRFVTPEYMAQATLWVQASADRQQSGPIQAGQLLQYSSWVDLLKSFVVLDEVVRSRRVYLGTSDPGDSAAFAGFQVADRFLPGAYVLDVSRDGRTFVLTNGKQEVQHGAVGDSIGARIGLLWAPPAAQLRPGREIRFYLRSPRDAALGLRAALNASFPNQGSFLRLELTGTSPTATAATLNAIADRFVEVAAELKRQKLSELTKILQRQLSSSYAALGRAERALETFRVRTITLPSEQASPITPGLQETQEPVFRAFFEKRVTRDQLERDRQQIVQALAQPDSEMSSMALEAIPSVHQSAELSAALSQLATKEAEARALRLQFANSYPPLHQLNVEIDALRLQTIPDLSRKLVAELGVRGRDLDAQIGSASRELQQIPQRAIEQARLRRDVTIAENLYTNLQSRYEEARLQEVSSIPDMKILDRAVTPGQPLQNRAMMLLLGGVFGGVGAGVGLVLLLDFFDRRVRFPEQVSAGMGLQILGALPRLKNGGGRGGVETEAQVVEALRTIRLNLEHAFGAAGPLVTTITSPGGGDGKSFLASNLAVAFADAGHRTIVIDGDVRRGTLHRVFGAQRKPGLLDLLSGQAPREQVVQATQVRGVEFIGCGTRRNAGPELLASAAMSQLLISLRNSYGVIIIDSAPLGAGVDPLVLGSLTGNLVLVLRTGYTDRAFAMAKLDAVSRLPIRVLGAVLNDVKAGDGYRYYEYLPGYSTSEEEEAMVHTGTKRLLGQK
jgi:succinoglycan biosynthesis transport protein ExoP